MELNGDINCYIHSQAEILICSLLIKNMDTVKMKLRVSYCLCRKTTLKAHCWYFMWEHGNNGNWSIGSCVIQEILLYIHYIIGVEERKGPLCSGLQNHRVQTFETWQTLAWNLINWKLLDLLDRTKEEVISTS